MNGWVFLNGDWVPRDRAAVSVEDRGFLFGDGIYEVVRYYGGRGLELDAHLQRLARSLDAVQIELPVREPQLGSLSDELMRRNGLSDGCAYWQVTRGAGPRQHRFPGASSRPTLLMMAYPAPPLSDDAPVAALRAVKRRDVRWERCAIKSICLLPNVLDSQAAADAGCDEAILVREDRITEGTHRSILVVERGVIWTHPLDGRILESITRALVLRLAREAGLQVVEEAFPVQRLEAVEEVIAVGSTTEVASVVEVDGRRVGTGEPGPVAAELLERYRAHVRRACGLTGFRGRRKIR